MLPYISVTMLSNIDVATLSKLSRGVEDNNHNGIFDEGDTLKAFKWACRNSAQDCSCDSQDHDYVLTRKDASTPDAFAAFLHTALDRRVRFFKKHDSQDGERTYRQYIALSKVGCTDDKEDVVDFVVQTYSNLAPDAEHPTGDFETDEIVFESNEQQRAWMSGAENLMLIK